MCLIHPANYLLDKQIAALEEQFVEEGGYSERLAAARLERRAAKPPDVIPDCPDCQKPMVLRTAKTGKSAGAQFWGCSDYPACKGVVRL